MSKKIYGNLEVSGNLQVNDRNTFRTFNGIGADANGNVDYPYYRKDEIDTILGMLPVSRIGTMDYLPVNVSGSFTGASNYSYIKYLQPIILEDDGTCVYLRSGTNGSTYGYYYTYVRNIRSISGLQQSDVVTTNTEYRPSIFTANQEISQFYASNAYDILFYKTTGGTSGDTYILALTNSTLSIVSHQSAQFPVSTFTNFDPVNASVIGSNVFIWGKDTTVTNNGYALVLYTVPVASIRAGNINSMTRVTGYNGKTVRNTAYTNSTNIRIWDMYSSFSSSDPSLYTINNNINNVENWQNLERYNLYCVPNSDNTSVRVAIWFSTRALTDTSVTNMLGSGFSFVYNISTKTITYDQTVGNTISISADAGGTNFTRVDPYQIDTVNITGYGLSLGNTGSVCQTSDGFVVSNKSRWSSGPTYGLSTASVNQTDTYNSWNLVTRTASRQSANINPIFGSGIGENLLGVRFLTKNKLVLACAGTENGNTTSYSSYSTTTLGSTRTYTYNSILHGTLTGYEPQTRSIIGSGASTEQYTAMISLIEANGDVSAYASSFIEGYTKPAQGKYNTSTGVFDNSYTMTNTVMQNLKNSIISNAGLTNLTKSLITIFYVPDSSFGNSIAVVKSRSNTNVGSIITAEVALTLSSNAITGGSVISTSVSNGYSNVTDVTSNDVTRRFNGLTIAKFSGFNYIGVSSVHGFNVPANTTWYCFIGKIKSGTIQSSRTLQQSYVQTGSFEPGVLPGVGFGIYDHSWSDSATKSVFGLYGTSEAQMDGMIANTGSVTDRIVVAAQEVPQGFNVYITQEVPVFLGGIFDKIAPVSYNLTTIKPNPANTTFYLYVRMDRVTKKATYVISTTLLTESLTDCFIGTIVTGATSIDTITTEKVTRFLTYRPSVTKRGSAIPASSGVPSGTGTRWH
jgi:hypothetical protein